MVCTFFSTTNASVAANCNTHFYDRTLMETFSEFGPPQLTTWLKLD
jgi:hypothetical protein